MPPLTGMYTYSKHPPPAPHRLLTLASPVYRDDDLLTGAARSLLEDIIAISNMLATVVEKRQYLD